MSDTIDRFMGPNRFLSNFWPSTFRYGGKQWMTVEHAFQAMKTEDKESREAIRLAPSPGIAKKMGRRVTLRANWESAKISIMQELLRCKFSDPALRQMLLATGHEALIEGNTWGDREWGVDLRTGEGKNMLGKLLMALRGAIRAGDEELT